MNSLYAYLALESIPHDFLRSLASFASFLIPIITVFSYEAPISLRIWIAIKGAQVKQIPSPSRSDAVSNERTTHVSWSNRVLALVKDAPLLTEIMKFMVFLAVCTDIVLTGCRVEAWKKDTAYFTIMFIPAGAACVKFYRLLWLPSELWVIHHDERGLIVTQSWKRHIGFLHTLASLVFALSITANAFLTRDEFSVNIILSVLVHPLLRNCAVETKSQSVKAFVTRTCALAMTGVVVAVGFIVMGEQIDMFTVTDKPMDRKWMKWFFSIMLSPPCFSYIIFFLRLDYAFANHDDMSTNALQQLPKSNNGSAGDERRPGTLVPPASSIPPFDTPYYTAAWMGYVVAILCLALLCSVPIVGDLPLIKMDESDIIGFYLAFLAPPLMCLFVAIRAICRGQLVQVWSYEGTWTVRKQDAEEMLGSDLMDEEKR